MENNNLNLELESEFSLYSMLSVIDNASEQEVRNIAKVLIYNIKTLEHLNKELLKEKLLNEISDYSFIIYGQ